MKLNEIKQILKLMDENDISEFEMEYEGFKIALKKGPRANAASPASAMMVPISVAPAPQPQPETASGASEKEDNNIDTINSPIVGTFYASASPEAPAYVQVGQEVKENDVLCIVEAMKVMNEIQSEVSGVIKEILVESGEPVEFGQPLFKIEIS